MMSKRDITLGLGDATPIRDDLPQNLYSNPCNATLNLGLSSATGVAQVLESTDSAGYSERIATSQTPPSDRDMELPKVIRLLPNMGCLLSSFVSYTVTWINPSIIDLTNFILEHLVRRGVSPNSRPPLLAHGTLTVYRALAQIHWAVHREGADIRVADLAAQVRSPSPMQRVHETSDLLGY